MVSFKLCISDPSSGKSFQKEIKDSMARPFIGLNIGETIKGDNFELGGYELQITGGSDYCGFPMRRGILGQRKKISLYGGIGFKGAGKGIKKRKTVCGHKIHESISQINLKVLKPGTKKLSEIFGVGEGKKEAHEQSPAPLGVKKPEAKEAKPKEEKKEIKEETAKETEKLKPEVKEEGERKTEDKKESKSEAKEAKEPKAGDKKQPKQPAAQKE